MVRSLTLGPLFARDGDSGAVIFDKNKEAVGLLFGIFVAKGYHASYALACRMDLVLSKLGDEAKRELQLKTKFN